MNAPLQYLAADIHALADVAVTLGEERLAAPYAWRSYSNEGVRFAFFRVLEELDALRAALRSRGGELPQARMILAGYNRAYRDLEAVVWGLDDGTAAAAPGGGEWDVRKTYSHILGADFGFYVVTRFTLELHRAGEWSAERKMTDEDYDRLLDTDEARYNELMESPLSILRREHRLFHEQVLTDFADVNDDELGLPSKYWEAETYPLRFRLGRFASHMRQHTIQIEKTLPAIGRLPAEGNLLVRQLFNRLAEIENAGAEPDAAATQPVRDSIRAVLDAIHRI